MLARLVPMLECNTKIKKVNECPWVTEVASIPAFIVHATSRRTEEAYIHLRKVGRRTTGADVAWCSTWPRWTGVRTT